ncbi:MAG: CinA family protein [Peptococcaceae bacterium]|nr:CinA family protein [Peptococcaceae bacterium]
MRIKNSLLAEKIVAELLNQHKWLATAESCTGGLIAATITDVAGSSGCFGYGVVTYSNEAKHRLIGVSEESLSAWGAVSPQVAEEMARGVAAVSGADIGIAVTGIAGPGGGSAEKPVGLVYIGMATGDEVQVVKNNFSGTRQEIRHATVEKALSMVWAYLLG